MQSKTRTLYDGDTFTHAGLGFMVRFEQEYNPDHPWKWSDGHGPVRKSTSPHYDGRSDKRPGERPLNQPGRNEYQFYYDWAEAMKMAKRDGWNTEPYDAPNRAVRAVQADFEFLRAYLNGEWNYCIVTVTRVDSDGELMEGASASLGMVETWNEYHVTVAHELADELAASAREAWRKGLHEARERRYWAQRDVPTEGTCHV